MGKHDSCGRPEGDRKPKKTRVSKAWKDLLRSLPGYDPFRDAEGFWFDEEAAQDAIDFFPLFLTHSDGDTAATPFELEYWQQAVVGNLFGWKCYDEYGREVRRYRQVLVKVGRKNGKTPLVAGIATLALGFDQESGAQCYICAYNREQAGFLFNHAAGYVDQDEDLQSIFRVFRGYGQRRIVCEANGGSLVVMSADAPGKHGTNPHFVAIDEIEMQPSADLVSAFRTAMVSAVRKQPLLVFSGTADYDRKSIANEIFDYAEKVRSGIINNPRFLPVIYEVTREEAFHVNDQGVIGWQDPEVWKKANPNLGVSVSLTALQEICSEAQETPLKLNDFLRFNLNIRTDQQECLLPQEDWAACSTAEDPLAWRKAAEEALEGHSPCAALDLGSTSDLTALALVFRAGEGVIVLPYFWIARHSAEARQKRDGVPYADWVREGWIRPTDGVFKRVTNFTQVRQDILELNERFPFMPDPESGEPRLAIDRLFQGDQLMTELAAEGLEVQPFGQVFLSMAAPTKRFVELVMSGLLDHGNNPVLRWMASNTAAARDDAGNLKPSKKLSANKIDGIVATIMALGVLMGHDEEFSRSVYEERGAEVY